MHPIASSTATVLLNPENSGKIGPVDHEIIGLTEIIKRKINKQNIKRARSQARWAAKLYGCALLR